MRRRRRWLPPLIALAGCASSRHAEAPTLEVANPVSITGAYRQTGGGLVAQAASSSSYGYLTVTGNATVANAAIVIKGSGIANGDSFAPSPSRTRCSCRWPSCRRASWAR